MDRSFLDLIGGETSFEPDKKAPIELMTEFLCLVSNEDMVGALRVCDQILEFEPTNSMMKDYKRSLQIYVQQAMDEREGEEDSDEEEEVEDGEEDEDDEDEEDDEEEPDRGAKS